MQVWIVFYTNLITPRTVTNIGFITPLSAMGSEIKINSINVRGLRGFIKRSDILLKSKQEGINVLCLQETHLLNNDLNSLKNTWNVNYFISGKARNAGGVLIVLNNNFEYKIHNKTIDEDGRFIILDIELPDVARFLLINLYAPNNDTPTFFRNITDLIEKSNIRNIIMTGDWNLVLDPSLDTLNYVQVHKPNSVKEVNILMEKFELLDIWRQTNPDTKKFSWRQGKLNKLARLDFFLLSESLLDIYSSSSILPSYKSDHSPISLNLFISKHPRGKGIWKLNNSLLQDNELKTKIVEEIELITATYACTPYNPNFVKQFRTENLDLMINIELFWNVLFAQLRGLIIEYASKKKKKNQQNEIALKKKIESLDRLEHLHVNDIAWVDKLESLKQELENIREIKLSGTLIRSRAQYISSNEKPSKFFLNLENNNFVSKHIRELKVGNKDIQNPDKILEEMFSFYQTLYNSVPTINIEDSTRFKNISQNMPHLNEAEISNIEKEISLPELHSVILKSKNNKSPGPDGFSNEFFKTFWPDISTLLLKLLNAYREKGTIDEHQNLGIITCIPKGGKLRNNLKNWRPITLLNSVYKFYSSILSERLKLILPKLIHSDQKGFINGRFIGENTRLIFDIIEECSHQNSKNLIVLIDFEKAFDSLSWNFIRKSLEIYKFGENTIKWVRSLQENSTSKILQNGHLSEKILLGRGCRQGDPISPYLFVLAAEFLSEAIRVNTKIEGINIHDHENKVSQYADDTSLFLKATEKILRESIAVLNDFETISGLKINTEKTKVVKVGGWGDDRTILCKDLNLEWTTKFDCLGISYDVENFDNIADENISKKINEIKKLINLWNSRYLTPFGKITIIKSLLISKITHVLLSLPTPSNDTFNTLDSIFSKFIWNCKNPKFRKKIIENPICQGGMGLTNLSLFNSALKMSWLKRLLPQSTGWAVFPIHFNIHKLILYGDEFARRISKNTRNKFWADVAGSVLNFLNCQKIKNIHDLHNTPLWHNSLLNLQYRNAWFKKGIRIVKDLLNEEGTLYTMAELSDLNLRINFLE